VRALVTTGGEGSGLRLTEVAEPSPRSHEALVRLRATSLNLGEVRHLGDDPAGTRLGWDVAGEVVAAAADGSGPVAGAPVVGLVEAEGWSELVAVPTHALAVIPDSVTYEAAAVLPIAGLTAWRALEHGGLLLGASVAVTGAAGGVGRIAVQLARLAGAEVTAVVGRAERAAGLAELGAAHIAVGHEAAPGPYDLVLESVGGSSLGHFLDALAEDGTLVSYGRSAGEAGPVTPYWFGGHSGARMVGLLVFTEVAERRLGTEQLDRLLQLLAAGQLDPQVALIGSWQDPAPLIEALLSRTVQGKAVLLAD
jgi:NADPH:quinone reductase-like Zn-dependent oxidoreductase